MTPFRPGYPRSGSPSGSEASAPELRKQLVQRRPDVRRPHQRLADQHGLHARGPQTFDIATAADAALGDLDPEYVTIADFDGHRTLVIAARVGGTRLIDNVPLDGR